MIRRLPSEEFDKFFDDRDLCSNQYSKTFEDGSMTKLLYWFISQDYKLMSDYMRISISILIIDYDIFTKSVNDFDYSVDIVLNWILRIQFVSIHDGRILRNGDTTKESFDSLNILTTMLTYFIRYLKTKMGSGEFSEWINSEFSRLRDEGYTNTITSIYHRYV